MTSEVREIIGLSNHRVVVVRNDLSHRSSLVFEQLVERILPLIYCSRAIQQVNRDQHVFAWRAKRKITKDFDTYIHSFGYLHASFFSSLSLPPPVSLRVSIVTSLDVHRYALHIREHKIEGQEQSIPSPCFSSQPSLPRPC